MQSSPEQTKSSNAGIYILNMYVTKTDTSSNFSGHLRSGVPFSNERAASTKEVWLSQLLIHEQPINNESIASVHRNSEPYNLQRL